MAVGSHCKKRNISLLRTFKRSSYFEYLGVFSAFVWPIKVLIFYINIFKDFFRNKFGRISLYEVRQVYN